MKANFALSLSFDGITLLERVSDGWCERGAVSLDTNSLAQDMAGLYETAHDPKTDAANVKLVLPNEQIKYLDLPLVHDASDQEIETLIRCELDGATPYAVSELRFDWCIKNNRVFVAAVAMETLEEAESFVISHGFTPVGHVAIAPSGAFDGEVHFGSFRGLSPLDRDDAQIVIVPAPLTVQEPTPIEPEVEDVLPVLSFARAQEGGEIPLLAKDEESHDTATPPVIETPLTDSADEKISTSGIGAFFVSKREPPTAPKKEPLAAPTPIVPSKEIADEKSKLTIFGARELGMSLFEKRRKLPLAWITAVLLLATIAGAYQLIRPSADVQTDVSLLSEPEITPTTASLGEATSFDGEIATDIPQAIETTIDAETPEIEIASVDPADISSSELDIAEIEAATETGDNEIPIDELRRRYALTGIWPVSPDVPEEIAPVELGDLYIASIDPDVVQEDAIALPTARSFSTETLLNRQGVPAPQGSVFSFTEDGLVTATKEGALSPDGHMVYLGKPPVVPPNAPRAAQAEDPTPQEQLQLASTGVPLQQLRPKSRPDINYEQIEQQQQRDTLALLRPKLRPSGIAPQAAQVITEDTTEEAPAGIAQEIAKSVVPKSRPKNLNTKVKTTQVAAVATPTKPKAPTKASVAANATDDNAINLRKVNLIGVFGKGKSRRALVRLSTGRRQMVEVGDRIDGGKVAAISDSELRYVKFGKNIVLKMPKG